MARKGKKWRKTGPTLQSLTGRRVQAHARVWLVGFQHSSEWEGDVRFQAGWYHARRFPDEELGARRKLINAVMLFNEKA